jgi:hypothetical protein
VDKLSLTSPNCIRGHLAAHSNPLKMSYWHFMWSIYWVWFLFIPILIVFWWKPLFANRLFAPVEAFFSRIAAHKRLAIGFAVLFPILFRVILIPIFPIRPPGVVDEYSYLLASDTFAHGRLTNPPHPMAAYLDTNAVLQRPTYASKYPPAQGAALAVGQLLGHPWFGVLLSMGIMFGALVWMLQGWLPPKWAILGAALPFLKFGTFSYWMNSYWGGAVAAIGGALVMGALPRILRKQKPLDALIMGIGICILANSRPYEGLLLCAPVGLVLVWWLCSRRGPSWRITLPRVVLPVTVMVLLTLAFSGYYNWRVTGDPFLFPAALHEKVYENLSIFIWEPPRPPMHYPNLQSGTVVPSQSYNAYRHTWADFQRITLKKLNDYYAFFVGPALLIPFLTIPLIFTTRRMRLLFFQIALFCLGLLLVIWSQPHYAAPVLGTFVILLTQMFRYLRRWTYLGSPVGIGLTRAIILYSVAALPLFGIQIVKDPHSLAGSGWGHSNWQRARIAKELSQMPGPQLVIVRYARTHHDVGIEWDYNGADIDHAKVVWVREAPGHDLQPVFDYFKSRNVWLVQADLSSPELERYTSLPSDSAAPPS